MGAEFCLIGSRLAQALRGPRPCALLPHLLGGEASLLAEGAGVSPFLGAVGGLLKPVPTGCPRGGRGRARGRPSHTFGYFIGCDGLSSLFLQKIGDQVSLFGAIGGKSHPGLVHRPLAVFVCTLLCCFVVYTFVPSTYPVFLLSQWSALFFITQFDFEDGV